MAISALRAHLSEVNILFLVTVGAENSGALKVRVGAMAILAGELIVKSLESEESKIMNFFTTCHAKGLNAMTARAIFPHFAFMNVRMTGGAISGL